MAEASTLPASRAAARGWKARIAVASAACLPRMCSSTSRALRAEQRTYRACARTVSRSCVATAICLSSLHPRGAVVAVAAVGPRRRELAQLVADHRLRDEHRHVLAAVVDRDRVADELGEDGRAARPGLQHALLARLVHALDPLHQPGLDERP